MAGEIYVDPNVGGAAVIKVGGTCYQLIGPSDRPPNVMEVDRAYSSCEDCEDGSGSSSAASSSSGSSSQTTDCNCEDYILPSSVTVDTSGFNANAVCGCVGAPAYVVLLQSGVGQCYYYLNNANFCGDDYGSPSFILTLNVPPEGPCYWSLTTAYFDPIVGQVYVNYGSGPLGTYNLVSDTCGTAPPAITVY